MQDVLYFQVDGFFCHCAGFDSRQQILQIHKTSFRHFEVKSGVSSAYGGIYRSPVRHQNTFEAPKIAQDINIQPFMFGGMDTVQQIVTVHYGADIGFLYSFSESREIDFLQSTFVYVRAGMVAAPFLVVGSKVFDCSNDSFRLYSQDILFRRFTCQVRVFTEVFKVTAAQRSTIDIHARTKQDINSSCLGVLSQALP